MNPPRPNQTKSPAGVIWAVIFTMIAVFVVYKVGHAISTRNHPPLSCYIVGGHWNFFNGWSCG